MTDATIPGQAVQGEAAIDAFVQAHPDYAPLALTAKAVLRGQQPAPVMGQGQKDPKDMAIMQMVYAANPQFNTGVFAQRQKALEGFNDGSAPSSNGGMVTNAETGLQHLATLAQASEELGKLQGNNWPVHNRLDRYMGDVTGGNYANAISKFEAAKGEFVLEATKFLTGGEGSDSARKSLDEAVDENATPETRRQAIQTFSKLMQDKLGVLGGRYQQGVGSTAEPYKTIDPTTQQAIDYVNGLGKPAAGLAPGDTTTINGVTIKRVN